MRSAFAIGGLAGAAGVALSAYAAHAGGTGIATAAQFLLFHAPAFLALGLIGHSRTRDLALVLLALGLALFAGDLAMREFAGHRLFPYSAPIGGMLLIVGWLAVAAIGLAGRIERR